MYSHFSIPLKKKLNLKFKIELKCDFCVTGFGPGLQAGMNQLTWKMSAHVSVVYE